jgi:hypothetical protein
LEVGRLGLMALLPLLVTDDAFLEIETGPTGSAHAAKKALRLAALVALNNLMIAAYPIVPRHSGKILCHLLRTCADLELASSEAGSGIGVREMGALPLSTNEGERLQHVALHVTSTALVLCGEKGHEFLQSLESDRDSYSEGFWKVVEDVREGARTLVPATKPIEPPGGLIQVL